MPLLLAGIDEAGYGPTLGPLCVACTLFRLEPHDPAAGTPNLWKLLDAAVSREPGRAGAPDARGRVAVADSKKLKLSNAVKTTHPLIHLERAVLSFLRALPAPHALPADDAALFESLAVPPPWHPCYADDPTPLPVSMTPGELALAAAQVEAALARAGLSLAALRCDVTPEPDFNQVVRETGSKGDTTLAAVARHLRWLWDRFLASPPDVSLAIACDRLGGRAEYAPHLEAFLPGVRAEVVHESPARSAYTLHDPAGRRAGIVFLTEGEDAHLPVALASMTAKYVRELLMHRFNTHWGRRFRELRGVEIKPTAGYAQDARRWLQEVGAVLPPADRAALVRIA